MALYLSTELQEIIENVIVELVCAQGNFEDFNSAHEGYAVLKEEVDELWDEIKKKKRNASNMKKEANQVAAMAIRFIYDCCKEAK